MCAFEMKHNWYKPNTFIGNTYKGFVIGVSMSGCVSMAGQKVFGTPSFAPTHFLIISQILANRLIIFCHHVSIC